LGWAIVLLAIITAATLRFWQLGDIPPGLYRDEAYNGLDALDVINGERDGQSPFYFSANNGREPLYIYLTSLSVLIFGKSAFAVRLAAAVVGTLTTFLVYKLAKTWFGRRVGWLSAWLWALTVWPVHLSRIGLRPVLLPFMMALTLWIATEAYRRHDDQKSTSWLWLLAGLSYGISFYTYLPIRFSLLFLLLFVIYLRLTQKHKPLWPGMAWAALGTAITILPLVILAFQDPDLIIGRAGQVSVLNPDIIEGSVIIALGRNVLATLGLFLVSGDSIIRHNPPGRPLFDLFMVIPFIVGIVWCLRSWRRPSAMALIIWIVVMLGPTILAEDAPHFLRAVGILPAAVIVPSIGLSQLWTWTKLPSRFGLVLVLILTLGSLVLTLNDYFVKYGRESTTGYWFESAARELAESANDEEYKTTMIDQRYREGWPSVPFLLADDKEFSFYRPGDLETVQVKSPVVIYAWPYDSSEGVATAIDSPATVFGDTGPLAQGDFDPEPYPLYIRYGADSSTLFPVLANFDNEIQLREAEATIIDDRLLQIDLYWSAKVGLKQPLAVFVHVNGLNDIIGQSDSLPSQGNWPVQWWQPGYIIRDRHMIELSEKFDPNQHEIKIGLYDANTRDRIPVLGTGGEPINDSWPLTRLTR